MIEDREGQPILEAILYEDVAIENYAPSLGLQSMKPTDLSVLLNLKTSNRHSDTISSLFEPMQRIAVLLGKYRLGSARSYLLNDANREVQLRFEEGVGDSPQAQYAHLSGLIGCSIPKGCVTGKKPQQVEASHATLKSYLRG